jgi:hypothetical protein
MYANSHPKPRLFTELEIENALVNRGVTALAPFFISVIARMNRYKLAIKRTNLSRRTLANQSGVTLDGMTNLDVAESASTSREEDWVCGFSVTFRLES